MGSTGHRLSHKGQILVLFAAALVVLCAVAALSIDAGSMVLSRSRLQNAADAAALAAVLELWEQRAAGASEAVAREHAAHEALRFVQLNYPEAGARVFAGSFEASTFAALDTVREANAARVITFRSEGAPGGALATFFASMLGEDSVDQDACSVARMRLGNMVPFGIWENDIIGQVAPGETLTMYDNASVAPGCFGLLDFDGGDHSADESKYWTRYGYEGPFDVNPPGGELVVSGVTGIKISVKEGVNYHIAEGDTVIGCIYREVWGLGSNAYFKVVGLVSMVVTEEYFTGPEKDQYQNIKGKLVATHFFSQGLNDNLRHNFMRLQLVQ